MSTRFFGKLYVQVLIGVVAGGLLGFLYPQLGVDLKPLGDVFIRLIKMVFAPVIFAMVVLGIARMESMKELGRVGVRALIYGDAPAELGPGHAARRRIRHPEVLRLPARPVERVWRAVQLYLD
jgi:hypothetical protein